MSKNFFDDVPYYSREECKYCKSRHEEYYYQKIQDMSRENEFFRYKIEDMTKEINQVYKKLEHYKSLFTSDILKRCPELLEHLL